MISDKPIQEAVVRVLPRYRCDSCGKEQCGHGATQTLRNVRSFSDAEGALAAAFMSITNNHMPYGWASYAGDKHKCPACLQGLSA